MDLRNIVIILATLTSFTKAADYWSDTGECEALQRGISDVPKFLINDEGIWKPDHGE